MGISLHACWVACLLGSTQGHDSRDAACLLGSTRRDITRQQCPRVLPTVPRRHSTQLEHGEISKLSLQWSQWLHSSSLPGALRCSGCGCIPVVPGAVLPSDQLGSGVVASCLARRWLRCPVLVAAVASLPGALHGSHSVTGSGFVCRTARLQWLRNLFCPLSRYCRCPMWARQWLLSLIVECTAKRCHDGKGVGGC